MHVFQYVLKHWTVAKFSFDINWNLIPNVRQDSKYVHDMHKNMHRIHVIKGNRRITNTFQTTSSMD